MGCAQVPRKSNAVNVCIDIGTTTLVRFGVAEGYQPVINGQANPETRMQFIKRRIKESIRDEIASFEGLNFGNTKRVEQFNQSKSEIDADMQ